ncbi:FkbM family methyltransferase [Hoeflea halophila]|uniref:FkbM family methyltransferase n=1 Tax=Hoeflea halophila TaxID=714899 RepID=A0A286IEJ3_9HYPH|nr:FkbM family methyltransferase [Hoeflea halophila]SOE18491.1 FkbM family methyltransferase [Hoeflea halophila]
MMKNAPSAFGRDAAGDRAATAYAERTFDSVPGRSEARALLDQLAGQPCLAAPVAPDAPLVIYGAGNFGRMALDFLDGVGSEALMVVDARADRIRGSGAWAGIDLRTPDEVPGELKSDALLAVSVVTSPVLPILEDLRQQGWQRCVPFYDVAESFRPAHPLSNGWFADPLSGPDLEAARTVLDAWNDDLSRAHHLMFLAWRLARQEWRFDRVAVDNSNRFFIQEIRDALKPGDLFIDGGAHHGSVSEAFLAVCGSHGRIVAFEPDEANADQFAAWCASLPETMRERIALRRVALDATPRERQFHDGLGYMSQLAEHGPSRVVTGTIDTADLAPGFVKLHLEGAELDALRGGLATFAHSRPLVAVTVYHNADGIWRTAEWMRENLEGYSLLMRTHSWCGTGAVIYAIPDERKPR